MADNTLYLTELILCIQHEVQSAVDYIAAQAGESTELGRSSAAMAVQTLRVRLPFDTEVVRARSRTQAAAAAAADAPGPSELPGLRQALVQRKGLALDIGKPGGMASYLKLKVAPQALPAGEAALARAEIEITFAPMQRPG